MDHWAVVAANVAGFAVMFGGIALCVRFDQQGKTRRRTLEHAERMRAIELGQKLDDVAVARYRALGAIGVVVPIVSLSAATIGASCLTFLFKQEEWRFWSLAIIYGVCAAVCLTVLPVVSARLRESAPWRSENRSD